jgi:hypothetical protein
MKALWTIAVISLLGVSFAMGKPGGGKGHGHSNSQGKAKIEVGHGKSMVVHGNVEPGIVSHPVQVVITPRERVIVRDKVYLLRDGGWKDYGLKYTSLPPGLAKKVARGEPLPPGWQKKVVVGQVLPVSIFDLASPVPDVFLVDVPRVPGTNLILLGGKMIRVNPARTVLDVVDLGL